MVKEKTRNSVQLAVAIFTALFAFHSHAGFPTQRRCAERNYQAPGNLQPINYIENDEPLCTQDFLTKVASERREPGCEQMIQKMAHIAEKNVRVLHCPGQGPMNVTFVSERVFVTNSHAYNSAVVKGNLNSPGDPLPNDVLSRCYVDRLDRSKGMIVRDFLDMSVKPRKGDPNSPETDFAVGAVKDSIPDIEPVDVVSNPDPSIGAEMFSAAAYRAYPKVKECFSLTACRRKEQPFTPSTTAEATVHITTCPMLGGSSGSGVYTLIKDAQGACKSIGLMAIMEGGTTNAPNGSPYYYSEDPNSSSDNKSMWTEVIGIDNKFRSSIGEVIEDVKNQRRDYSETVSKVPAGQDL